MVRVLIVEDSPTTRMLVRAVLESDPEIQVIGEAANGEDAIRQTLALKPDLITMDIIMPVLDGLAATRRIMERCPTPIVVLSASNIAAELGSSFDAIRAGALDVIAKPLGLTHRDFDAVRERLTTAVKLMAEIKVARHVRPQAPTVPPPHLQVHRAAHVSLIAMGASTGGPSALNRLLKSLPANFPLSLVVSQHITNGFTEGLVRWLQMESRLVVSMAHDDEPALPGHVYFAPDGCHLEVGSRGRLRCARARPGEPIVPSVDVLFESVARVYGAESVGVLLTGMGSDGARGLLAIHRGGGVTIAQDETTAAVYGMPKAAVDLGAVDHVVPIGDLAALLGQLVSPGQGRR